MKRAFPFIFLLFVLTGCNSFYNTRMVNLEILEPANVFFSPEIRTIAVKYNNANVSYNPYFAGYTIKYREFTDGLNNDSILSEKYYTHFIEELIKNNFFDTVLIQKPAYISDTYFRIPVQLNDSTNATTYPQDIYSSMQLATIIDKFNNHPGQNYKNYKTIHPRLGLYDLKELRQIKENTGADLLLSLDYFATSDYYQMPLLNNYSISNYSETLILIFSIWSVYNLNDYSLKHCFLRNDSIINQEVITWHKPSDKDFIKRNALLLDASRISAEKFVYELVPHWVNIQRTYYSVNTGLKKANALVESGKWDKASEIWLAHVNHRNRKISSQCRFNMAVYCEVKGDLKSAFDWLSKSYELGKKNEMHNNNCMDYIRILSLRKHQAKLIDRQLKSD